MMALSADFICVCLCYKQKPQALRLAATALKADLSHCSAELKHNVCLCTVQIIKKTSLSPEDEQALQTEVRKQKEIKKSAMDTG